MFTSLALVVVLFPQKQRPNDYRESMWRAPTASEWAEPTLLTFERTWEDALAVAEEAQKPILVCVNMDGEIASEHYAGVRYRQPSIAALYSPYVCLIASVYRHTEKDHDANGRRILCPRFGSVTCGEHIATEVLLYKKYFDGTRVAPRHIMIELDESEVYDLYYANDTDTVFETLRTGIGDRDVGEAPTTSFTDRITAYAEHLRAEWFGDPKSNQPPASLDVWVLRKGNAQRSSLEQTFVGSTDAEQKKILSAILRNPEAEQPELLRIALAEENADHQPLIFQALTRSKTKESIAVVNQALRKTHLKEENKEALIQTLDQLGTTLPEARHLATLQRSLSFSSKEIDADGLAEHWIQREYPAKSDAEALLILAEAHLSQAVHHTNDRALTGNQRLQNTLRQLQLQDALEQAEQAEALGAKDWRALSIQGLSLYYLKEEKASQEKILQAVRLLPEKLADWNSLATLSLFTSHRRHQLKSALKEKRNWPASWMEELQTSALQLLTHPLATEDLAVEHYDFLVQFGAYGPHSWDYLKKSLEHLGDSWELHARARTALLFSKGPQGLETFYETQTPWYAGLAHISTAEHHRKQSQFSQAKNAYKKARVSFGEAESTYQALIESGLARMEMEAGHLTESADHLFATFRLDPKAAEILDGLNVSARMTAVTLLARLEEQGENSVAERLRAAAPFRTRIAPPDPLK